MIDFDLNSVRILEAIALFIILLMLYYKLCGRRIVDFIDDLKSHHRQWNGEESVYYKELTNYRFSKSNMAANQIKVSSSFSDDKLHNGHGKSILAPDRRRLIYNNRTSKSLHSFATNAENSTTAMISQFKSVPTILPENNNLRPFSKFSCTKCSPLIRSSLVDGVQTLSMKNILWVQTLNSNSGFFSRRFCYLVHVLKTNASFVYPNVWKDVLTSERVNTAIDASAMLEIEESTERSTSYNKILVKHRERAKSLLKNMQSGVSRFFIKLAAFVLFKLFSRLLLSIQVHKSQLEVIKSLNKTSFPIIYLPLHRSHMDYILITFILVNYELPAPYVASGDNLRIPVFGPLLRGLGAFFIKRKLDPKSGKKDYLYRAVLHTYVEQCLSKGQCLEFFIEGGRSRSGKACLPKAGLLSIVVDAYRDGVINDAHIVPIAINYEKLLDNGFLAEQLGKPKTMETFSSTMRGIWKVMNSNYGNIRVDFAKPFSLREFIKSAESFTYTIPRSLLNNPPSPKAVIRRLPSSASLYGTDVVAEDQRTLVKGLAEHVLNDAVHSVAYMSTNLVAFLLLNKYRNGAMLKTFVQDFNWLWAEITERGRTVGFSGNPLDIIVHAIALLGDGLVKVQKSEEHPELVFISPNLTLPYALELSYYSNVAISAFLGDAVIATAMFNIIGEELELLRGCKRDQRISKQRLIEISLDLCFILQYEFILTPPCKSLDFYIEDVIEEFSHSEMFLPEMDTEDPEQRAWTNRFRKTMGDYDEFEDTFEDELLRVNLSESCIQKLVFFRNILVPFIEGYWQLANCLRHVVQNEMEERKFISLVQNTYQDNFKQGVVKYPECIGAETLRNCMNLLVSWKVMESYTVDDIKIIFLSEGYNSEELLTEVIDVFARFRK